MSYPTYDANGRRIQTGIYENEIEKRQTAGNKPSSTSTGY
jgi:hypothetical protein